MTLHESLRALAIEDDSRVPPHVDAAVMAAWDASRQPAAADRARSGVQWSVWGAAGAAALVLLVFALAWRADEPAAGNDAPPTTAVHAPALRSESRRDEGISSMTPASPAAPVTRRAEAAPRPVAPRARGTEAAYVLVPEVGIGGPLTLMRVRMARSEFSRLGVPISNPDGDGLVDVEVLVGEDGVARSIQRAVAVGWMGPNP